MTFRAFLILVVLAVSALFSWSQPAHAAYPCPGGPGADEVQVGESGGGGGVASVPMCNKRAGAAATAAPPTYYYTYGSIAWHADVDDVWMVGNYTGPYAAEREALAACNRAMGGGCSSIGEWHNSSMSIIRDRNGTLWNAWNGQGGAARKKLLAECSAKQLVPCEVVASFGSGKRSYSPNLSVARKKFSVAAWVDGREGFNNKLYIAGGHNDWQSAENAALDACSKATGRKCGVLAFAANGVIQTFRLGNGLGSYSATAETNGKRAQKAAQAVCKREKQSCTMQIAYDSRTPGLLVHDFEAGAMQ